MAKHKLTHNSFGSFAFINEKSNPVYLLSNRKTYGDPIIIIFCCVLHAYKRLVKDLPIIILVFFICKIYQKNHLGNRLCLVVFGLSLLILQVHPFQVVEWHVDLFKPQEMSSTAWAFATASQSHEKLFAVLAAATVWRVGEFNSQAKIRRNFYEIRRHF